MSKKKSNNSNKEKVNSPRKNNKKNITGNEFLSEEKKSTNFEEQINIEKDKFLRLFAEFENYKKRTTKERIELFKTANQELMLSILPVIDDFERAIDQSKNSKEDIAGFILIKNKFFEILKSKGLSPINISIGDKFDSETHEAISQIKSEKKNIGKVIEVIEKGYTLGEKIIRYPKVIVGN